MIVSMTSDIPEIVIFFNENSFMIYVLDRAVSHSGVF